MVIQPLVPSASPDTDHVRVTIGGVTFGGAEVPVIAGPCSVEPGYVAHAHAVARSGAAILRGCVYKPRTRPNAFQGMGAEGLALLDQARAETGLPILAEPLSAEQIDQLLPHVDGFLVGARSMQNTPLLTAVGQTRVPVVLKRGMSATYDEWLGAADYILDGGNDQIVLCERGIRTFETTTRNTLDLGAIAVLRERTPLPIIVDPSHAAGNRSWVPSLALAAVAAGADGLIIEAHPEPARSVSDADQAITPATLERIISSVALMAAMTRRLELGSLSECRSAIDTVDSALAQLLNHRAALVSQTQRVKRMTNAPQRDPARELAIQGRLAVAAPRLDPEAAARLMTAIVDACLDSVPPLAASA